MNVLFTDLKEIDQNEPITWDLHSRSIYTYGTEENYEAIGETKRYFIVLMMAKSGIRVYLKLVLN